MRLKVSDLLVGTEYALQVRVNDGEDVSEWSRRFQFVTVRDDTEPKVPTNITWVVSGDSYMAEWDSVEEDVQGRPVSILRYGIRITSGAQTKVLSTSAAPETTDGRQRWDLMFQRAVNIFGLGGAKEISFSVRSVIEGPDGPIKSQWSTPITASNDAPDAPTNGVAKSIIDGVELSWTQSSDTDVKGYNVYVSTSGSDFTPSVATKVGFTSSDTFTYFTGTYEEHYFKVRAVDAYNQESSDLDIVGAPTSPFGMDDVPPPIPAGLAVTRVDSTTANATWGAVEDDNLLGYHLNYIRKSVYDANLIDDPETTAIDEKWAGSEIADFPSDKTEGTVSNLRQYEEYIFRVRGYDSYGNFSPWSSEVTLTAEENPIPAPVSGVTVVPSDTEPKLSVSWDKSSDADIVEYQVQIDRVNTFDGPFLRNYYINGTAIEIADLVVGIDYFVRIRAIDSRPDPSVIPWSTPVTVQASEFSPSDGSPPATAPTGITATVVPGGAIHVSWDEVPNADTVWYNILVTDSLGATVQTLTKNYSTSVVVTGLTYDETYTFEVTPEDADDVGPLSASVTATPTKINDTDIASLGVGKLTSGIINTASMVVSGTGEIKSSDYNATNKTGWIINDAGITLYEGSVSASLISAGTISSTTVNIGAGGVLNVDSTAVIKSSNYVSGSQGWRLSSTGLEVNQGSVSASLLTGGTLNAGAIYVASGGGIYDSTGGNYWSITSTGINVYNGTISGASVITNSLRSSWTDSTTGRYLFAINSGGYAEFSGARIYGNTILGSGTSHFLQSYSYSPSTAGWKIDGSGNAYFNDITAYGTLRTSSTGAYAELSSANDLRLFSGHSYDTSPGKLNSTATNAMTNIEIRTPGRNSDGGYYVRVNNNNGLGFVTSNCTWEINNITTSGTLYVTSGGLDITGVSYFGQIQSWANHYMNNYNLLNANDITSNTYSGQGSEFILNPTSGQISVAGGSSIRGKFYATAGDVGLAFHNSGYGVICGPAFDGTPTSGNTRNLYATRYYAFTTTIGSASDRRVKKDIAPFGGGIDILKKVDLVSYRLKDDERNRDLQYGVIAQDSLDLMEGFIIDMFPDDDDDLLAANYHALNMATTSAVQELIEKIETLESRINELESRA